MIVSIEKPEESDISKVYLMLGPACNLKCRHCYQTDVPMPRLHKTIHEDVWKFLKYLKETYAHNPKRLVFWGGEPLLYWNLIKEVVEKLGDSAFSYWIMSNGVLLKDEHVDFINAHEINLSISNDGPLTAKVRGVNVLDDPAFCERFNKVKHRCIGITTHAYNIDPYTLAAYIEKRLGQITLYYQYILECTFDMDADLYDFDLQAYQRNLRRCRMNFIPDFISGDKNTPARAALRRGVFGVERSVERRKQGLDDEWYPECCPMRNEMNVDILGFVHACHNRASVIGRVTDGYERLLASNDDYFRKAIAMKTECLSCEINDLCRHGCPLNPMSEGQRRCCEAEKVYWQEAMKTVLDGHMQGVTFLNQNRRDVAR